MNVILKFKKDKKEGLQNCGMVSLTSIHGNETGLVILQTISRHMKKKEAIGLVIVGPPKRSHTLPSRLITMME